MSFRQRQSKGFTLIEVMIVIVIIGILATVAINITLRLTEKGYIKTLESDLSMAYKASVLYYSGYPDGTVSAEILNKNGYIPTDKVNITIDNGTMEALKISARHPGVSGVYAVDHEGRISKQ